MDTRVKNKIMMLQFICSLLVIWIHALNLGMYGIDSESTGLAHLVFVLETTFYRLCEIAVPAFFFTSGFLFYKNFEIKEVLKKYRSRVRSVLIPYILWCSIYYFVFIILTNMPYINNYINSSHMVFSFSGWIDALWIREYSLMWFLKELIIYIIACPIVYYAVKNKYIGALVLIVLLFEANNLCVLYDKSGLFFYVTGAYLATNFRWVVDFKSKAISLLALVCIFVFGSFRFKMLSFDSGESPVFCISVLATILSIWFVLDLFDIDLTCRWWMRITFFTYVSHELILETYEKIVYIILGKGAVAAFLDYIFVPMITFVTILVVARFMKNRMPRIWMICTGGRG